MRRLALVLVLAALALAASATAATGLRRHPVSGQGLSLSVPAKWVVVDSRLPASFVDRIARENPGLAPFVTALKSPTSPTKFIALDPQIQLGFATNVNVVATPLPTGVSFEVYRAALKRELQSIVHGPIAQDVVRINGARAVRVRYRLQIKIGKTVTVQTLQYGFPRAGRSVVVTYSTLPQLASRYERTFAASAASIRFSRP